MPIAARAKLPSRFLVLAAAGLAAVGLSACDASSGPTLTPEGEAQHVVTVIGSGEVQGTPDTLTIDASVEFIAPDVAAAMNQTNERQRAVIDALVGMGIERKDISTTQASVQPQFAGGDSTAIIGYRASNSINVKVRQPDMTSQAFGLIVSTGGDATRINNVNYTIEDDSQLVRDARAGAFNDAKDRAEQYAELSGLDLGKVVSISESPGTTPPVPLPRGAEMAAAPFEPGQQTVEFSVTVIWELDLIQPAGAMSTGMPLSTAVPDSGSRTLPSLSWFTLRRAGWQRAAASCRRSRDPIRAAATRHRAASRRSPRSGPVARHPGP